MADFPRAWWRGFARGAVDEHVRGLSARIEELERTLAERGELISASAGTQISEILQAAESTAADIERRAREEAERVRGEASADAARTREEALDRATRHVDGVSVATAAMLERVQAIDGEMDRLADSVRATANRLAADLGALEGAMGELYDAGALPLRPPLAEVPLPPPAGEVHAARLLSGDLDGARLAALNMALNGESREDAERVLGESFQIVDRRKLIDEVYAAIEG